MQCPANRVTRPHLRHQPRRGAGGCDRGLIGPQPQLALWVAQRDLALEDPDAGGGLVHAHGELRALDGAVHVRCTDLQDLARAAQEVECTFQHLQPG